MKVLLTILVFLAVLGIQESTAQSLARPAPGYKNTLGTAFSSGVFLNKEAVFWGLGVDYSRLLSSRWVANVSMNFDQEISESNPGGHTSVNTLSPSLAFGYVFSQRFVLGVGAGVGIFDDDNENRNLAFNLGSWTVGLIGVYTIYQKGRHGFDISGGIEQGIGNPDLDITLEFGYGYSF